MFGIGESEPTPSSSSRRTTTTSTRCSSIRVREGRDEAGAEAEARAQICEMLTVHATIEEEIFYPADPQPGRGDRGSRRRSRGGAPVAQGHHRPSRSGAAVRTRCTTRASRCWPEYVKHHVKEEENEIFPKVRSSEIGPRRARRAADGAQVQELEAQAARSPQQAREQFQVAGIASAIKAVAMAQTTRLAALMAAAALGAAAYVRVRPRTRDAAAAPRPRQGCEATWVVARKLRDVGGARREPPPAGVCVRACGAASPPSGRGRPHADRAGARGHGTRRVTPARGADRRQAVDGWCCSGPILATGGAAAARRDCTWSRRDIRRGSSRGASRMPEAIPATAGGGTRHSDNDELWSPTARAAAIVGGGLLALSGASTVTLGGLVLAAIGIAGSDARRHQQAGRAARGWLACPWRAAKTRAVECCTRPEVLRDPAPRRGIAKPWLARVDGNPARLRVVRLGNAQRHGRRRSTRRRSCRHRAPCSA
jgi:hypothetical protein